MTMDPELLKILRCPETQQPLTLATERETAAINQRIAAGTLRNHAGQVVQEKIEGGLIRADRLYIYPIRRQIPVMLIDEAIQMGSLGYFRATSEQAEA